jgi:hypothetical protein
MKHLVGKEITKKVPFMGDEVEVRQLTVGQAREIEALTKEVNKQKEADRDHLALLRKVVRIAVVGAEELTDDEIDTFPITELTALSQAIMGQDAELGND